MTPNRLRGRACRTALLTYRHYEQQTQEFRRRLGSRNLPLPFRRITDLELEPGQFELTLRKEIEVDAKDFADAAEWFY